ncbi:N-acetyltransferase [Chitinophaga lutea]|uniref:N-acetyltransferase n=1 Tax=Chitinophaga lutea TaxID=2488634 RepID=A0A3N4PC32_9BACT|nr:GNAT family N-acetyltransferase [Chitinophaga lutea]RPE05665.1 N-acetyltransferase [Chitinophaga lutea]
MEAKLLEITDNVNARQYEAKVGGQVAKLEYMFGGKKIFLTHMEVPQPLAEEGVGEALIERVLQILDEQKLKMVPLSPHVTAYLRKHPEWKRILAHGINL